MNYRLLIDEKWDEFLKAFPHYRHQEIVYAVMVVLFRGKDFKKSDLLSVSDEDYYNALCKAFIYEKESVNNQ